MHGIVYSTIEKRVFGTTPFFTPCLYIHNNIVGARMIFNRQNCVPTLPKAIQFPSPTPETYAHNFEDKKRPLMFIFRQLLYIIIDISRYSDSCCILKCFHRQSMHALPAICKRITLLIVIMTWAPIYLYASIPNEKLINYTACL